MQFYMAMCNVSTVSGCDVMHREDGFISLRQEVAVHRFVFPLDMV